MRKRIKQLLSGADVRPKPVDLSSPSLTPELTDQIMIDIDQGNVFTYEQIASKLGCSVEKVRFEAKKETGVLRTSKTHRVPDCVYRRMILRLLAT
jgi:hypothetical protein